LLGGEPLVLFLDELPPYLEYAVAVPVGNADLGVVTTAALANLFVAVADMSNVCLVLSDLAGSTYRAGRGALEAGPPGLTMPVPSGTSSAGLKKPAVNALHNWEALAPEERWWLYTMTVATTGQAMQKGLGWRKALRAALADNPFVKGEGLSLKARRELLGHSQLSLAL
jgi:hypothetical protein